MKSRFLTILAPGAAALGCLLAVAALQPSSLRAAPIRLSEQGPQDVDFCKEVLILHHSHVDIGYTHPQSMYWELQKGYMDAALDMLDRTEKWKDDVSRPRWTAEVTSSVMQWLQTAAPEDVKRLKRHVRSGRFGIAAFQYNTTPLSSAEGLARQLYDCRELKEKLGVEIRTAHQHDVNGIPWPAVDLLLDAKVELLTMGINLHLGGSPARPAVYRWKGPSGRELLVMNGEHYTMFDQWCNPASGCLDTMEEGLFKYLRHVKGLNYPYDFIYLTATCAPYMYDNSPPNQELPDLIRRWNEEGRQPRLRMVTSNELLDRIRQIPREQIPVISGDWTDFWNFGSGSSAAETRLTRESMANAEALDLLRTWTGRDPHGSPAVKRLWENIHLYNEHTWGAHNTLDADNPFVVTLWQLKAQPAHEAKPLSDVHLRRQLHQLAGNPWQSRKTDGVLVVNPTGLRQDYFVPGTWKKEGKQVEPHYLGAPREQTARPLTDLYGPVALEPFSWQIIPWSNLAPAVPPGSDSLRVEPGSIETGFYRLTYEPKTGKITGLVDKKWGRGGTRPFQGEGRQIVPPGAEWGFFQLVHERPSNKDRHAFHVRDMVAERYGRTGWKPGWEAVRSSYTGQVTCRVENHGRSATLIIKGQAEGLSDLEQRVTLHADSPMIDLSAQFLKQDVRSPEAVYFVFPLELAEGWRSHFDTASVPVELDAEQIPGACRDWATVDGFVSVHQPGFGVTLYCPDAPMVQIGGFNWAKNQTRIPRERNPLLLAWPLNNYWETNFRASQPGLIRIRYSFSTFSQFDPVRAALESQQTRNPPATHLVFDDASPRQGRFFELHGQDVIVTHAKPAEDGRDLVLRLLNLGQKPQQAKLTVPGQALTGAWRCGTLEDRQAVLDRSGGAAACLLQPRELTTVRLRRK
jgi:alpha-mannosidase